VRSGAEQVVFWRRSGVSRSDARRPQNAQDGMMMHAMTPSRVKFVVLL